MSKGRIELANNLRLFEETEFFNERFNFIHSYLHVNYKYEMHMHQFFEMNIIVSGKGMHYIENSMIEAGVGDVFIIPPGVPHSYHSDESLDIYHVLIKKDFLTRYSEEIDDIDGFDILFDIEPRIRRLSGKNCNLKLSHHDLPSFKEELERMIRAEKSGRYVYLNALTLAFICRLCRRVSGSIGELGGGGEIIGVMEYIKNNLDQKLTLEELCRIASMSRATLNRRFNEALGQSPMNYVLFSRVSRAKELIEESNLSKTEIAHLCGFYDVAHMNKYI